MSAGVAFGAASAGPPGFASKGSARDRPWTSHGAGLPVARGADCADQRSSPQLSCPWLVWEPATEATATSPRRLRSIRPLLLRLCNGAAGDEATGLAGRL